MRPRLWVGRARACGSGAGWLSRRAGFDVTPMRGRTNGKARDRRAPTGASKEADRGGGAFELTTQEPGGGPNRCRYHPPGDRPRRHDGAARVACHVDLACRKASRSKMPANARCGTFKNTKSSSTSEEEQHAADRTEPSDTHSRAGGGQGAGGGGRGRTPGCGRARTGTGGRGRRRRGRGRRLRGRRRGGGRPPSSSWRKEESRRRRGSWPPRCRWPGPRR